jgi:predicted MFS family arabinose efflux permease
MARWRTATGSVIGLLATVNLLNYANRSVVSHKALFDDLRAAFDVDQGQLGLLLTWFIIPHALVTLPVSWLGDRFDRRRVIAVGLILWSVAALLCAISWSMTSLLWFRAAVGAATAACVPMANAMICDLVAPARRARIIALFNLGLFLGGVTGIAVGGALGFPWAFVAVGAPGLVLAVMLLAMRVETTSRPAPERLGLAGAAREVAATFAADLGAVLGISTLRWMMLGAVLVAFAAGAYVHWFIEFLIVGVGLSESAAGGLFALALLGGVVGVVAGGVVADRLYARSPAGRQQAVALGFTLAVPCALGALHLPAGPIFYIAGCLMMFFVSWYHGPIAAAVDDLVPPERAATAQGTYIATMHLLGTAPAPWLVGELADEIGLRRALLAPTAAMAAGAVTFAVAAATARRHGSGRCGK